MSFENYKSVKIFDAAPLFLTFFQFNTKFFFFPILCCVNNKVENQGKRYDTGLSLFRILEKFSKKNKHILI